MLVAWRYAVWRVLEVRVREDKDLTEDDWAELRRYRPEFADRFRPYTVVLGHERGPTLVKPSLLQRLHDGSVTVHLGVQAGARHVWNVVDDRYPVCSCHGEPWPCQEVNREEFASRSASKAARQMDGHAPGVCYHCREPITRRQASVTFPEPSAIVPGAPGPSFHLRSKCWHGAVDYEVNKRLPAYADAQRLVSCPGVRFIHGEGEREDCSAGPACTGHHKPPAASYRQYARACITSVGVLTPDKRDSVQVRPATRCDADGCTGLPEGESPGSPNFEGRLPLAGF